MELDLISRVHFRSDGLGPSGVGAAAQTAGAELRGGELAGAGRSGASVGHLGCGWVQNDELGMGCPLGYLGRRCKAGSRLLDGEGGSAATEFAGVRGLGT